MLSLPDFREKQLIFCFCHEGQKIAFRNDNLLIEAKSKKIILQITCYKIFALFVAGSTSVTTGILERSKKFRFPIVFMSYSFRVTGVWTNGVDGNYLLRQKQYAYEGLAIARHIVRNKVQNQLALLKMIRGKNQIVRDAIIHLDKYCNYIPAIAAPDRLLGCEGLASRVYFKAWFGADWQARRPRTKIDIINACLDIGYTILFNILDAMLSIYGFDLYKGVYHREFYQRKSLVCDLVEPFRIIVDKTLKKALNISQIKAEHFSVKNGKYILLPEFSRDYSRIFVEAILGYKEEIFLFTQKYYRAFMQDKPIAEYPVFLLQEEDN
jgi:CRISPR-associated protein Cas1